MTKDSSDTLKIDDLYAKSDLDLPLEPKPLCPGCTSANIEIEYWDHHYPYYRCISCYIGFWNVQWRAGCNFFKTSVTREQCVSCKHYTPTILDPNIKNQSCQYWVGILEPPHDIKKALKLSTNNLIN